MREEEWRTIVIDGETWNYEVSNTEKVRNVKTGRILKQSKEVYSL